MTEHDIFAAAIKLAGDSRSAFLNAACGQNAELREQVDSLLRAHDESGGLLPRQADTQLGDQRLDATLLVASQAEPGTVIAGRYKLLEVIGEGGMGSVWVAEQSQPVKRKVALKLIKAGMDSKSVLARFEAERQALAVMDHPNIAKVLDGGLTEQGRPYFVMEYVKGMAITEYCDSRKLSVPERLQLFAQVCQAVQHAHQKGIIHRDLKPSNILVASYDDKPVPKVIDFGLAKAIHQSLTENTLHTAHDMVLGTPLYMSPEQAQWNNIDIDTRSDIYSLGVLLYELLTGSTPLEKRRFKQAAWDEVRRMIREEDPPRPSLRLSSAETLPSVAAGRHTEPARLTKLVRGELDWIVMKALEKDRTRRYETANGFASDVLRYLSGEPVLAAPPSTMYRFQKFILRNKGKVIASGLVLLALLAGMASTSWQWYRAEQSLVAEALQRKKAEENERIAQEQSMLALKNIQLVVTEVDDRLAREPAMSEIRIAMLQILEKKWDELDLAMTGGVQGQAIPTLMTVRYKIAKAWESLGKLADADEQFAKLYAQGHERLVVKGRLDSPRYNLAVICRDWAPIKHRLLGGPAESEKLLQESLALLREIIKEPQPREDSPAVYEILSALGATLQTVGSTQQQQGRLQLAEVAFREAVDVNGRCLREIDDSVKWYTALPDPRKTLVKSGFEQSEDRALSSLAGVLVRRGLTEEAIPLYEAVVKRRRTSLEQNPKDFSAKIQLTVQLISIGQAMILAGRLDSAGTMLTEGRDLAQSLLDLDGKNATFKNLLGVAHYYLGTVRYEQDRTDEALADFERSRLLRTEIAANSPDISSKVNLMLSEARMGNVEAAEKLIDELGESDKKNGDLQLDRARALAQLTRRTEGDQQTALRDAALTALERAAKDGYSDPFWVRGAPDLKPLREAERFKNTVLRLEAQQATH